MLVFKYKKFKNRNLPETNKKNFLGANILPGADLRNQTAASIYGFPVSPLLL